MSPLGAQNKDLGVAKQAISDHARRFSLDLVLATFLLPACLKEE